MGVRLLQTFLDSLKNKNVKQIHLRELNGKKIAVDISIYLYRFKTTNQLLENIYLMCSIFRYYNIHPIFVFDGKPDEYKREILEKRYLARMQAKRDIEILEQKMNKNKFQHKFQEKLNELRKKSVSIKKSDVLDVKNLLDVYGMTYVTAKREADEVCAALYLKNKVYACLTEDTDIMAYGCTRIIRYFSLMKHTCVMYNMTNIIHDIQMSPKTFKELCCCSGNDYLQSSKNIFNYYDLYIKNVNSIDDNYLNWLSNNKYISCQKCYKLKDIYDIYSMKNIDPFDDIPYVVIRNKKINNKKLVSILKSINFVFP